MISFVSQYGHLGLVMGFGCMFFASVSIFLHSDELRNSVKLIISSVPRHNGLAVTLGLIVLPVFLAILRWRHRLMTSKSTLAKIHRRRLTPIGKFALLSQTEKNPSIIAFFIALASKDDKGLAIEDFRQLWNEVLRKHERLRSCIHYGVDTFFEDSSKSIDDYLLNLPHPRTPEEFKQRLNMFLTAPINVENQPLQISLSSGPMGASGAIMNHAELILQGFKTETVALFRIHHVICDGVSLSSIIKDTSDEKDQLDTILIDAIQKQRERANTICAFQRITQTVMYYMVGSIVALAFQMRNMLLLKNPFDEFTKDKYQSESFRSVSWKFLSTVEEAKSVTKEISRQICLNDLFVYLLSSALERQYQELKSKVSTTTSSKGPSSIGIVVPVHLTGSILPGQSISNNIGAFVAALPFNSSPNEKRTSCLHQLLKISRILRSAKHTPAPQISRLITSLISKLGNKFIAKQAIVRCNCHASAVISNVHGFPFELHWNGNPIKSLAPFLPLPPNIKVGVGVFSYDGKIVVSVVSSDKRVVPDTNRFLDFMFDEYEAIKNEVRVIYR